MFKSFQLELDGGNSEMDEREDIVRALRKVADQIEAGADSHRVLDSNGNTVGDYAIRYGVRMVG